MTNGQLGFAFDYALPADSPLRLKKEITYAEARRVMQLAGVQYSREVFLKYVGKKEGNIRRLEEVIIALRTSQHKSNNRTMFSSEYHSFCRGARLNIGSPEAQLGFSQVSERIFDDKIEGGDRTKIATTYGRRYALGKERALNYLVRNEDLVQREGAIGNKKVGHEAIEPSLIRSGVVASRRIFNQIRHREELTDNSKPKDGTIYAGKIKEVIDTLREEGHFSGGYKRFCKLHGINPYSESSLKHFQRAFDQFYQPRVKCIGLGVLPAQVRISSGNKNVYDLPWNAVNEIGADQRWIDTGRVEDLEKHRMALEKAGIPMPSYRGVKGYEYLQEFAKYLERVEKTGMSVKPLEVLEEDKLKAESFNLFDLVSKNPERMNAEELRNLVLLSRLGKIDGLESMLALQFGERMKSYIRHHSPINVDQIEPHVTSQVWSAFQAYELYSDTPFLEHFDKYLAEVIASHLKKGEQDQFKLRSIDGRTASENSRLKFGNSVPLSETLAFLSNSPSPYDVLDIKEEGEPADNEFKINGHATKIPEAMDLLDDLERRAIDLRFIRKRTVPQVAHNLRIPVEQARDLIQTSLVKMKTVFEK